MIKGYIREINLNDAKMVLDWRNQDFVRNNMYNNNIIDYETHIKWFNKILNSETCKYFIYENKNIPMGVIGFTDIDKNAKKASWAFYLGNQRFRGAGSEMEQLALDYAFNQLGLYKLSCEVLEFNYPVVEFHRKFGFDIEGIKKHDYYRDGEYYDIYQLALFREEYTRINNSLGYDRLPKIYSKKIELVDLKSNSISELMRFMDNFLNEFPGENFVLTQSSIEIQTKLNVNDNFEIKAKVLFQSLEKVKIEYILHLDNVNYLKMYTDFSRK